MINLKLKVLLKRISGYNERHGIYSIPIFNLYTKSLSHFFTGRLRYHFIIIMYRKIYKMLVPLWLYLLIYFQWFPGLNYLLSYFSNYLKSHLMCPVWIIRSKRITWYQNSSGGYYFRYFFVWFEFVLKG